MPITLPPNNSHSPDPDGRTQCLMYPSTEDQILSRRNFPQPIQRLGKGNNGVVHHRVGISGFPNGGLGVFATVDLKKGDLIFSERAFFVVLSTVSLGEVSGEDGGDVDNDWREAKKQREKELGVLLDRMSKEEREAYLALANSQDDEDTGPLLGIWQTNAFGIPNLKDSQHEDVTNCGVFKDGSRMNTSCSPNVGWSFNLLTFAIEFRAARKIKQGEELTTRYNRHPLANQTERREALASHYGFTCECHSCTRWPSSDLARTFIQENAVPKRGRLADWLMNKEPKGVSQGWVVEESIKMVTLIEREGLETTVPYIEHLGFLFEAYCAMGDEKEAVNCLRKHENIRRVHFGGKKKSVRELSNVVKARLKYSGSGQ
ncbi:hypothetical protein V5O48_015537 [Marasmius crinis-equi]|uniref:SET domain-containing protein n=1 Tax=Marasmius crinis-equi TaxID=585013 RepID=A0ABR3EUA4_9AGAR